MKRLALSLFLVFTAFTTFALGDVVYLKDGGKLEGQVRHIDDGWIVVSHGVVTRVRADQVLSIELTPTTGPVVAAERLASLRHSVENLSDQKEILARYQRFIDQAPDAATAAEAKKDLVVWQDRASQNMVKVGDKWVLPEERAKLVEDAAGLAERARQLLKQGRSKEAEPLLVEATTNDPQNPAALYLLAFLRYQQEQLPAAHKALEAVAVTVPNHAPTLNNLAVVQWRQRQFVAALANYDAAMLASPVNKDILDNVASALQALPEEYRNSAITQKTLRHFKEQDKTLGEQMAALGWHRYGTTWVTNKELDQIKQQEKETHDKLDALATEFDKCRDQVDQIDRNIDDTESAMHRMEAQSFARDPTTGAFIQLPLPASYYDLQRDDQRMHTDRVRQVAKMDSLKQSAQALQRRLSTAQIDDVQKMIGPEGTPLRLADVQVAPTTNPSTTQPDHAG